MCASAHLGRDELAAPSWVGTVSEVFCGILQGEKTKTRKQIRKTMVLHGVSRKMEVLPCFI